MEYGLTMSNRHNRQAQERNRAASRPQVQAAPEYGTLLVGGGNIAGSGGFEPRKQPTGEFYWFCPECRRKNLIPSSGLNNAARDCEHCKLKVEIVFEPVDQVPEPTEPPRALPSSEYVPRGRRILTPQKGE